MIAGVLTANELALLRTRPQRTQLYLAIPDYHTIYTARVNNAPASSDDIFNIEFDGGAGTLGHTINDILPFMTVLVGSTPGAWDIGIARMRDNALDLFGGTGLLPIGASSEIDLANDQYLTIIDDYGLWPRHPFISVAGTSYMDYNVAYTNQNVYGDPVPIMGTHAVIEVGGVVHFDASSSYNCIGTPNHYDYEWFVDNVSVATTPTVDIAFPIAGTYTIRLEVTADYAIGSPVIEKTSVAVRYVIVHDAAHPLNASFALEGCEGDFDSGGWSYRVTMNAKASEAYIRDRTLCLLVARDWYGDTEQSIGPLDGRENIICVGWVDGESLRRSNDKSMVSFEVQGPAFWLGTQEGFPTGIDDTTVAPTDWSHIQALDPRKGLFSFLHWRTTSTVVMDCYITSDNHRLATTYTPAGTLLEQLRSIAERVNAKTVCDRYGRLFCEIDTQFITPVLRTFPVVQTLSDRDWRDEISIERHTVNSVGQVDLSGVYWSGTIATSAAIFALSPGHIPSHYGEKRQIQRIALDDQAEANTLAGLWLGYLNNEYPNVDTPFSSNYRAVDIAPRMFVQMNLAAGDTPRGLTWTNKKLIPRRVSFGYDAREALLLTDITFEAETFASDAVTGDPPIEPPDPPTTITPVPPVLCDDPTALNFGGLAPCIYPPTADLVILWNATQLGRSFDFYTAASPTWDDIKLGGLLGANVGQIYNATLCVTGECWLITLDPAHTSDNGVWYCSDITAAAPSFSLIKSVASFVADGLGIPHSMGCDDSGIVYTGTGGNRYYCYGTGSLSVSAILEIVESDAQFSISPGNPVRIGCGAGGVPAYRIYTLSGAVFTSVARVASQTITAVADGGFCIQNGTNDLWSYADDPGMNTARTLVYSGTNGGPCVTDGSNCLTIRSADGYLMNGAAPLATPLAAFGAGRSGAGFCLGVAGFGEVIWVASNAGAATNFVSLRDTGGTWSDKSGNWVAAIGNWAGNVGSICAMPMTVAI